MKHLNNSYQSKIENNESNISEFRDPKFDNRGNVTVEIKNKMKKNEFK